MGVFVVGDVVVVPFPYSNFKSFKRRPALVVGNAEFDNLILCQITSNIVTSKTAIKIRSSDFEKGNLPVPSLVRPDKLFTVDPKIIQSNVGKINSNTLSMIRSSIKNLFD